MASACTAARRRKITRLKYGRPAPERTWRPENELWDDLRGSRVLSRWECLDYPYYFSEQVDEYDPDYTVGSEF